MEDDLIERTSLLRNEEEKEKVEDREEARKEFAQEQREDETQSKSMSKKGTEFTVRVAKDAFSKTKVFVVKEYVRFKNDPKKCPWWLSWLVIISALLLIPALIFDLICFAFKLNTLTVLIDIYNIFGCLIILGAEYAKQNAKFRIRSILHYYFAFCEFSAGKGTIQVVVGSLCVTPDSLSNLFKFIIGIILLICGICNIVCGVYAAYKLKSLLKKLMEDEEVKSEDNQPIDVTKSKNQNVLTITEKLDLLDRKFEALNKRGDNQLTKADLREGISEFNLNLSELELDAIFESMDINKDKYISKDEFEIWWFKAKAPKFL